MTKIFYEKDVDTRILDGKTIAIFGYGSQGAAQAQNLRDSGVRVILGLRPNGRSWRKAKEDGFTVYDFKEAAKRADILHFLIPDERHKETFDEIKECITPGKTLMCSHGFNFNFKIITPPKGVDVIMVAPKAPGPTVRREYVNGFGVPALVAVFTDESGHALQTALAIAKANGHTRVGVFKTTFKDETETDLFGEQTVLCGGAVELMRMGFDVLVKKGYPPEIAYFECVHEMKLIVDLIYKNGMSGMYKKVSNTAKYGGLTVGPKIITSQTKKTMLLTLKKIQNGSFAKQWIHKEFKKNKLKNLEKKMKEVENWHVEKVGKNIREFAGLEK
ncbi:MAG: ketol-acid reductoisomerase [Candidatus Levybacteria bacterium RIFCSPHIGHO2_12_FULL_38_12]|nr:MAG: ketol-acid reductoisomerase [Candidatus Levybacteria bacterium RIFCSPHIGHO2_01_FULL_38_12]OGH22790.1 MAG: ketol-acid reductoisomerase [Candidatus Levybacteria bacterium RIFCSPHIGHO2_12_FULL_38_12]OGH33989.1 MAG: ketol-acid reductoisomerase [Candidatus Levybacteria bacterium RIFCSPLOWO2_01_FULL_37_20]OGH44799.1 MAG: ketol-acid reductoisomerase [Candidatus Levybacteria bacterium RIFCSPLOWO2_02_FULL_37_18]